MCGRNKKGQAIGLTFGWYHASDSASTSVVNGKQILKRLGSLQIAGRHFARLPVALQFKANLLAFDELAHTGAFDCRDVDECIGAAIVRLDEAKTLGGIEPFNCAVVMMNPFKRLRYRRADALQMVIAIFERKGSLKARCQTRGNQSSASKYR